MRAGEIVMRQGALFAVQAVRADGQCELHGLGTRLWAVSRQEQLAPADGARVCEEARRFRQTLEARVAGILASRPAPPRHAFLMPGKVLHIDADEDYLRICAQTYARLAVPNACVAVPESAQPKEIDALLHRHLPDILVLTGHDALMDKSAPDDLAQYKSTAHFAEAVRRARRFQSSRDGLAIIAGACQSHFEHLLEAGANVASAPDRVRIHALDALLVAEKMAYTPIDTILAAEELIAVTITGARGLGGCQTRGALRLGAPRPRNVPPEKSLEN